jgi:hypothetical protein
MNENPKSINLKMTPMEFRQFDKLTSEMQLDFLKDKGFILEPCQCGDVLCKAWQSKMPPGDLKDMIRRGYS